MSDTASTLGPDTDEEWVTLREASEAAGVSVSALRKAFRSGRLASRLERGPYGDERHVELGEVRAVMGRPRTDPRTTSADVSSPVLSGDYLPVPRSEWAAVMAQLGNLHQAGQDLAEARERAARAETEAAFLRERLAELRERTTATSADVEQLVEPAPRPRRRLFARRTN